MVGPRSQVPAAGELAALASESLFQLKSDAADLLLGATTGPTPSRAPVPRAVLALHPLFSIMAVCLARLLHRMFVEHLLQLEREVRPLDGARREVDRHPQTCVAGALLAEAAFSQAVTRAVGAPPLRLPRNYLDGFRDVYGQAFPDVRTLVVTLANEARRRVRRPPEGEEQYSRRGSSGRRTARCATRPSSTSGPLEQQVHAVLAGGRPRFHA